MDDIELETRSMVDEGAELKHGVTCLRSRPIENSLMKYDVTRRDQVSVVMDAGWLTHSQFYLPRYNLRITLKSTTLVGMRIVLWACAVVPREPVCVTTTERK